MLWPAVTIAALILAAAACWWFTRAPAEGGAEALEEGGED